MANKHRGEIEARLDGTTYRLCLTLGALAELEAAFGDDDMLALASRFQKGRLRAVDCVRIIGAGLRGGGHDVCDELVGRMQADGGASGFVEIVARLRADPLPGGAARPWDVGVLWNRDPRIALPLMEKLAVRGLKVGDNLPYSGRKLAYTINMHGAASGLANCVVEINQDQVADDSGVERWTGILADVMREILALEDLHLVRQF